MPSASSDRPFRVARSLVIRCVSPTEFDLRVGSSVVEGGVHTLRILEAFRIPRRIPDVIENLGSESRGAQEWVDLAVTIHHWVEQGILVDAEEATREQDLARQGSGFDSVGIHVAMLADEARTLRFLEAIAAAVKPGDVVVDLGTGSGVLAVAAARAGARRVYAIEATRIASIARRVCEANGVADRVTVVEGYSTGVDLPEKADVLVSEIIGNDPLGERILECMADAVKRFLRPGGRVVPQALDVYAVPVQIPQRRRSPTKPSSRNLARWRSLYGIDLSPLARVESRSASIFTASPKDVARWIPLAEPSLYFSFDLALTLHPARTTERSFQVSRKGRVDAVLFWFEVQLTPGVRLGTDPRAPRADNHWQYMAYKCPKPLPVQAGDSLHLRLADRSSEEEFAIRREARR